MSARKTTIIGIVCGVLCAALVLVYITSVRSQAEHARTEALARYGGEQVEVCVATSDIAPGDTVKASDVTTKLWVADLLPSGAIKQTSDVVGKVASSSILTGEVVIQQRFQNESSLLDVPAGLTAISVPAKSVQAVGGALNVGMNVDVYSTGNSSTTRLLNNVSVLATSTTSKSESNSKSSTEVQWITIAVPAQFVEEVVAAAQQSQLYFTLPNNEQKITSD